MKTIYSEEVLRLMRNFIDILPERSRRLYAAVESAKLGHGGTKFISKALNIDPKTIRRGRKDWENYNDTVLGSRQRKVGGGRKKKAIEGSALREKLISFIEQYKAGSPTDASVYWVSLRHQQLALKFTEDTGIPVSNGIVKRLLRELGYRYRTPSKVLPTGVYAKRDEQFKIIFKLIALLHLAGENPIISIDCKKKERLGNLARDGKCLCTDAIKVYDHDYAHLSEGKVIPHGIYDLRTKMGYLSIGTSSETAEFVYDNLLWWWTKHGIRLYPNAKSIVILCDSGGANSYRHHIFKYWMLKFAKETGVSLSICHYPPYASKWNPIEHRLFCHVHRATAGVVFDNYQTVLDTMGNTCTKTGIKVKIRMNNKFYKTGVKMDKKLVDYSRIRPHPKIPELNYEVGI